MYISFEFACMQLRKSHPDPLAQTVMLDIGVVPSDAITVPEILPALMARAGIVKITWNNKLIITKIENRCDFRTDVDFVLILPSRKQIVKFF